MKTRDTNRPPNSRPFERFVAVLGWDDFSIAVTRQLLASSNHVVVLTDSEDERIDIEEGVGCDALKVYVCHLSNYAYMKEVGLDGADSIFVNLASDEENLTTILRLKSHFQNIDYMVALSDDELEETFQSAGVTYAISKFNISSKILASFLYEPDVAAYAEDLLTATQEEEDHDIQQYLVTGTSEAAGMTFADLMRRLRDEYGSTPIGLKKASTKELIKIPRPEVGVEEGDYVLLVLKKTSEPEIEAFFQTQEGVLNGSG